MYGPSAEAKTGKRRADENIPKKVELARLAKFAWSLFLWRAWNGGFGVNGAERIALLVFSCPAACIDVTPVCGSPSDTPSVDVSPSPSPPPPSPSPPPPAGSGSAPVIRCTDDPAYLDIYSCRGWVGYNCANGGWGVDGAERIALLLASCPVACLDGSPNCS